MITNCILKEIGKKLEEASEEISKKKRFDTMRKTLYLLDPKDREDIDRVLRLEKGHLSPELEKAWRNALKQAEETS